MTVKNSLQVEVFGKKEAHSEENKKKILEIGKGLPLGSLIL